MNQRGTALGSEFRGKGVNVALGPMMLGLIFDNGNQSPYTCIGISCARRLVVASGRGAFFLHRGATQADCHFIS